MSRSECERRGQAVRLMEARSAMPCIPHDVQGLLSLILRRFLLLLPQLLPSRLFAVIAHPLGQKATVTVIDFLISTDLECLPTPIIIRIRRRRPCVQTKIEARIETRTEARIEIGRIEIGIIETETGIETEIGIETGIETETRFETRLGETRIAARPETRPETRTGTRAQTRAPEKQTMMESETSTETSTETKIKPKLGSETKTETGATETKIEIETETETKSIIGPTLAILPQISRGPSPTAGSGTRTDPEVILEASRLLHLTQRRSCLPRNARQHMMMLTRQAAQLPEDGQPSDNGGIQ